MRVLPIVVCKIHQLVQKNGEMCERVHLNLQDGFSLCNNKQTHKILVGNLLILFLLLFLLIFTLTLILHRFSTSTEYRIIQYVQNLPKLNVMC